MKPSELLPLLLLSATLILALVSETRADEATERGYAIMSEADARNDGFNDMTALVTMILTDASGREKRRRLDFALHEIDDDGDRQRIVFRSPGDVRGTALLTHSHVLADDSQWLYLPAFKRIKRISAANQAGPFVGSEFAYEDLVEQDADNYVNRYLRDDTLEGVPCYVVERVPRFDNSGYRRQVVYVDQAELRYRKIEFFDKDDRLLKTLRLERYQRYLDHFWRALSMTMINHQSDSTTVMLWEDIQYGAGLSANAFTPNALKRLR
jgi:outer membrane lipoprotein-sorting protein